MIRFIRRLLEGGVIGVRAGHTVFDPSIHDKIDGVLRAFMILHLMTAYHAIFGLKETAIKFSRADPLWLVSWTSHLNIHVLTYGCILIYFVSTLCLLYRPSLKPIALIQFLTFLFYASMSTSFGKVNHGLHFMLWTSFLLLFMPAYRKGKKSRKSHYYRLNAFWNIQTSLLFFYTLSGFFKVYGGVVQMLNGEVGLFHPEALPMHIARRYLNTMGGGMLGEWFSERAYLCWPLMLGAIYIEFFAILIIFRRHLYVPWGLSLFAMHIGIGMVMGIWFIEHSAVMFLFLVCSPLAIPIRFNSEHIRALILDLPPMPLIRYGIRCLKSAAIRTGLIGRI